MNSLGTKKNLSPLKYEPTKGKWISKAFETKT
jgi:hypothetical protein